MTGRLVLVGTPLGNRGDLSPRGRETLLTADLLLCEDTRSPLRLLGDDAPLPPRRSCFVGNEHQRCAELLLALEAGQTVAFCSEAGMPGWSDPGRLLVQAAVAAGHRVDAVPGPTAAATALALSGFDSIGSVFIGFLPRSGRARSEAWSRVRDAHGAVVLYEAGNRTGSLIRELSAQLPDADTRRCVVARELTKLHQQLLRGTLTELERETSEGLRGEVTVVLDAPAVCDETVADGKPSQDAAQAVLEVMLDPALKPRARSRALAKLTGLHARELYARLTKSD